MLRATARSGERVAADSHSANVIVRRHDSPQTKQISQAMTTSETDRPETDRSKISSGRLRSDVLLAGTHLAITALGSALLASGVLA